MAELLPCPFCGWIIELWTESNRTLLKYWVECNNCDSIGPRKPTRQEAIKAWNTRTQENPKNNIGTK